MQKNLLTQHFANLDVLKMHPIATKQSQRGVVEENIINNHPPRRLSVVSCTVFVCDIDFCLLTFLRLHGGFSNVTHLLVAYFANQKRNRSSADDTNCTFVKVERFRCSRCAF